LAQALLKKETIDKNDIREILEETGCEIPESNRRWFQEDPPAGQANVQAPETPQAIKENPEQKPEV
jgi:hypothetical protein